MTGSSRKIWGATKGLGEAPKSCTRKEHESATNSIAKRGQGGTSSLFVCPLWGLGQRPNCFAGDYSQGSRQQRRRQRSVPASNFARPQTRPQAALPPRFREEPNDSHPPGVRDSKKMVNFCATPGHIAQFSSIVNCAQMQTRPPAFPLTSAFISKQNHQFLSRYGVFSYPSAFSRLTMLSSLPRHSFLNHAVSPNHLTSVGLTA